MQTIGYIPNYSISFFDRIFFFSKKIVSKVNHEEILPNSELRWKKNLSKIIHVVSESRWIVKFVQKNIKIAHQVRIRYYS